MSLIVASRFTTLHDAEVAVEKLQANGFVHEDVASFYVNPGGQHARFPVGGDEFADPGARKSSLGAATGAAAGAVVGLIVGVLLSYVLFRSLLVLAVAAGVGAYVGTLGGALWQTRGGGKTAEREVDHSDLGHEPDGTPKARESGVLVAVHVSPGTQQTAAQVLGAAGGMEIERADGRWQQGHWADFDPTRTVQPLRAAEGGAR
ncbi:hypothetical protein [Paraburkholderia acidisoli]|uniref:Glycine zipper domain-containing protein n=1 Tax=Paraburkholderia acidisoli TaxID=2571748 RepID=A0A7Z2GNP8_9BURK|nr:hypothetical protein [Paraburkholderia acidisoli]QGZ64931.1 hypothetical protein FAZ98_24320 [Paraburkholderia acidisoli]